YGALRALAGVSLAVEAGEFFGLLGPNGAGKTTLINVIAGLVRADSGQVRVMGADVVADYRRAASSPGCARNCFPTLPSPCANAAQPVGLLRHPRQRPLDRRSDAPPRP